MHFVKNGSVGRSVRLQSLTACVQSISVIASTFLCVGCPTTCANNVHIKQPFEETLEEELSAAHGNVYGTSSSIGRRFVSHFGVIRKDQSNDSSAFLQEIRHNINSFGRHSTFHMHDLTVLFDVICARVCSPQTQAFQTINLPINFSHFLCYASDE